MCHPEPAYAEAMLWLRAGRLVSGSRTARNVGYIKKFGSAFFTVRDSSQGIPLGRIGVRND